MLEESEARNVILESVQPGPVVWVPLQLAHRLVLAQELHGVIDSPSFDKSGMDGYAVRAEDAISGAILQVSAREQPAGPDYGHHLASGEAIRIFTGGAIPHGADAVIMQEDVEREEKTIRIVEGVAKGENIRRRGGDICRGQKLLDQGESLTPSRLGLLASQGFPEIPVHCRPMVNIVTTGDELVEPGESLAPGEVYNSNGPMLHAAVEEAGAIGSVGHANDDRKELRSVLTQAISTGDMAVIAGGVSVGERDFVKEILAELGVETGFWRVRIKPGKPFLFGKHPDGGLVFGLPGNPVSAYVTFRLFVQPAILKRLGFSSSECLKPVEARAAELFRNKGDRPHYLRGIWNETSGEVFLSGTQQSHAVFGLSRANCLIRMEPESSVGVGDPVKIVRI